MSVVINQAISLIAGYFCDSHAMTGSFIVDLSGWFPSLFLFAGGLLAVGCALLLYLLFRMKEYSAKEESTPLLSNQQQSAPAHSVTVV
eukprot:m.242741 g.242741  ORF g.242741 m.242741 type:complete len:88 (+) comp54446_c0_seq5:181-444(+)